MTQQRLILTAFLVFSVLVAALSVVQLIPHLLAITRTNSGAPVAIAKHTPPTKSADDFVAFVTSHPSLTDLFISQEDNLTTIPPEIATLTNLRKLTIDGTQLSTLPEEIGQLTALTSVTIHGTPITTLPPAIADLRNLELLDASNNAIAILPDEIGNLTALTKLTLSNNMLTEIPPSIGNLTNLTSLDLRNNKIFRLPDTLRNLTKLQFLFLGGNPIEPSYYATLKEMLPEATIY